MEKLYNVAHRLEEVHSNRELGTDPPEQTSVRLRNKTVMEIEDGALGGTTLAEKRTHAAVEREGNNDGVEEASDRKRKSRKPIPEEVQSISRNEEEEKRT